MKVYGMLTVEELQKQVDTGDIDTVIVVFTDLYGRIMGKRLTQSFFWKMQSKTGPTVVIIW